LRGAKTIRVINLRAFSCCEVLQKLGNFAKFASLGFPPFFWCLLKLLLMLLLEDGCLLHASTPCSRSLHLRQQQPCPRASLLEKLELHWRQCMGLLKGQMGQERYLLVSSRCLRACSGQCQPQSSLAQSASQGTARP